MLYLEKIGAKQIFFVKMLSLFEILLYLADTIGNQLHDVTYLASAPQSSHVLLVASLFTFYNL